MTDRPIIFSGPMVLALLEGRKTQERRLLKLREGLNIAVDGDGRPIEPNRYVGYAPGDRLWVRERIDRVGGRSWFAADKAFTVSDAWPWTRDWLPLIYMPKGLSRLTLTVTDVRVQRVQEITASDARAEGHSGGPVSYSQECHDDAAKDWFMDLWDSLNAKRAPWESNPWIVALTFTVARENIIYA